MLVVSFVLSNFKIGALSGGAGILGHHSLVELQWSLLLNAGEHEVSSVKMAQVSQSLAHQLLLHGLVGLSEFVVLGSDDRDWDEGSVDPLRASGNFGPVCLTCCLYLSEIVDFVILQGLSGSRYLVFHNFKPELQ